MSGMTTILLILVGLIILAFTIGVLIFLFQRLVNPDPTTVQLRLAKIKDDRNNKSLHSDSKAAEMAKRMALLYKSAEYQNIDLGRFLERYPFLMKIKRNLRQADMKITVDRFFLIFIALPGGLAIFVLAITQFLPLVALLLLIPVGAIFMVNMKKGKRMQKFLTQMPDALSLMSNSLRAGHSFQSAITVVSSEMQAPIGTEFNTLVKDMNLGIPVRDALTRFMENLDALPDVRLLVTAVLIQRESGGNLAEILDKLGYIIRERFKLKGQISALTGQSRLTGYVLGAAPIVLFVGLSIFFPSYIKPLYEEPIGKILLVVAGIQEVIGFSIIKKIVDIRA